MTKAQAATYARDVNLRAADLPDMKTTGREGEGKGAGRADRELAACDGGPDPDGLISRIKSATFTGAAQGQYEVIRSNIEVQPTPATAARNDAIVLSRRGFACVARFLPRAFASGSGRVHYGRVKVSRQPTPLPGVKGSFGLRIATSIIPAGARAPIPFYIDEFGFVSGRVEVSLMAVGAPQAVPAEAADRLVLLLYTRAAEHRL